MIVPMLRVGMPQWTLCVLLFGTRSVPGCIPTRSVGTINNKQIEFYPINPRITRNNTEGPSKHPSAV
jgi:hypothetical protein